MRIDEPRTVPNLKPATAARDVDAMRVLDSRSVVGLIQLHRAVEVASVIEKIDPVRQHRKMLSRQATRMSQRGCKRHDLHQPGEVALA